MLSNLIRRFPITCFLLLTLAISWPPMILYAAGQAGVTGFQVPFVLLVLYAQFGPTLAAIVVIGGRDGRPGLRRLWEKLKMVRIRPALLAFVVLLYPAISLVSMLAQYAFGGSPEFLPDASIAGYLLVLLPAIILGLIFGGLTEELGWRGFLQPALEKSMSWPIAATASVPSTAPGATCTP